MMRKDRTKEKERLMNEVLGKDRSLRPLQEEALGDKDTLFSGNQALSQLSQLIRNQKKELEQTSQSLGVSQEEFSKIEQEIKNDFGIKNADIKSSRDLFEEIEKKMNTRIIGQIEAIHKMTIAYRRPIVMGMEKNELRNTILISGPNGTGRHSSVVNMAKLMKEEGFFDSDEVRWIDMSIYNSPSQEHLFLQDLYSAIQSKGSVICFENFEQSYPSYVRMLNDLAIDGKVMLNKRYISKQGQLLENTGGLMSDSIDSLSVAGKYILFITESKISKVIDTFGTHFTDHVLDYVEFQPLDKKTLDRLIESKLNQMKIKLEKQLHVQVEIDRKVKRWVYNQIEQENGAESVKETVDELMKAMVQYSLEENIEEKEILITIKRNPIMKLDKKEIILVQSNQVNLDKEEIMEELDEIVGLQQVKKYIFSLENHVLIQQRRRKQGLKATEVSKHMIFTGNPGTGKTTIARLISRYMKAIGALSQGQLVEVTRADLVGKYVGHTAPLTMQVIKSAIGGVLFIDEAYSLYRGKDDNFGLEAIDTLVKAMEDHREDLIVILAGYTKEMDVFLEANSGLKSRFPNIIQFEDYNGQELMEIAHSIAKGMEYKILPECDEALVEYFNLKQALNAKENGNGRLARNKVEEAILNQSSRIAKNKRAKMDELILKDFDLTD